MTNSSNLPDLGRCLKFLALLCLAGGFPARAIGKIEWEKINDADLKMTSCEAAPEAPAVILFDRGTMAIGVDSRSREPYVEYQRYQRMKILNEAGYDYASFRILCQKDDVIEDLEARTIMPDGRIIDLDKKDYHKDTVKTGGGAGILYGIVFTFPALEPGCIVEYMYVKKSKNIFFLDKWYFSNRLYTFQSEFTGEVSSFFVYNYYLFPPGAIMPSRKEIGYFEGGLRWNKAQFVWALDSIPGIAFEPYSPPFNSRRIQLFFAISALQFPAFGVIPAERVPVFDSWDSVCKNYYNMYRAIIKDSKEVQAATEKCTAGAEEKMAKIGAIFKYLKEHCSYLPGGGPELFPAAPKATLESGKGDAGDLSALMVQMLRDAGLEAYPAVITTRDDPPFLRNFPSPTQFSKMIVYIFDTVKPLWIDPAGSFVNCKILPWEDQGQNALIINSEKGSFATTPVSSPADNFVSYFGTLTLEPEGAARLDGWVAFSGLHENRHAEKLKQMTELDRRSYVKDIVCPFSPEANLTELDLPADLRAGGGLRIGYSIDDPATAQLVSGRLLLNPALCHRVSAAPFEAGHRENSIFFEYPSTVDITVKIPVPAGFILAKVPQPVNFKRPYGEYVRYLERDGETLFYHKKFTLAETVFPAAGYQEIQKYYQQLESLDEEMLVFKSSVPLSEPDSSKPEAVSSQPK